MRNYGKCVQKEKSSSIRTSSSAIKKKELSKERKFQSRTSLEFYNKKRKSEIIERKKARTKLWSTWLTIMNKIHEKLPKLRSTNLNNSVHLSNSWRSVIVKKRKRKGKIKIKTEERKARRSGIERLGEFERKRRNLRRKRTERGERKRERETSVKRGNW